MYLFVNLTHSVADWWDAQTGDRRLQVLKSGLWKMSIASHLSKQQEKSGTIG